MVTVVTTAMWRLAAAAESAVTSYRMSLTGAEMAAAICAVATLESGVASASSSPAAATRCDTASMGFRFGE